MTNDEPIVFLDSNVIAKAVSRTLMLRCALSGYTVVWSVLAEQQAEKNRSARTTSVAAVRERAELLLGPTGQTPQRFATTSPTDRQILADAEACGATFLVTEDVDDFGASDLASVGVSAVNHDLFLAERAHRDVYRQALVDMVSGMRNPSRTPAELHSMIARQHPRLFAAHADLYDVEPQTTGHAEPAELFRGRTCLRCLVTQSDAVPLVDGVCPTCR